MTSQASHDEVGTEPRTEAGKRTAQLFRELAAMNGGVGPSIAGIIAIENEAAHAAYDETKATIGAVKTQASERIRKAEAAAPSAQPDVLREAVRAFLALHGDFAEPCNGKCSTVARLRAALQTPKAEEEPEPCDCRIHAPERFGESRGG